MVRAGSGVGGQAGWWNPGLGTSVYVGAEAWGGSWTPGSKGNEGACLEAAFAQRPYRFLIACVPRRPPISRSGADQGWEGNMEMGPRCEAGTFEPCSQEGTTVILRWAVTGRSQKKSAHFLSAAFESFDDSLEF